MRRLVRGINVGCCAALLLSMVASGASAKVVSCDDIAAAQGRGLAEAEVRQELQTTAARIESCARQAEMAAQQNARRGVIRERRALHERALAQ